MEIDNSDSSSNFLGQRVKARDERCLDIEMAGFRKWIEGRRRRR